jgi:hypothetical protein
VDPPARFVRQYAFTRGRVQATSEQLTIDTLVRTTALGSKAIATVPAEQADIMKLATTPISIAELSAHLGFHLGIVQVLVGDLSGSGYLTVRLSSHEPAGPDLPTLERLLDDLQTY